MFQRETMFEPILQAHPDFRVKWEEFLSEWRDHPKGLPCYLLMSDLVGECSSLLRQGRESELEAIFRVVERWLHEGDRYVRDAAVVGFLEDLQNQNLHEGTTPDRFVRYLEPESLRFWHKVERFWNAREPIVDDRPAPPASRETDAET